MKNTGYGIGIKKGDLQIWEDFLALHQKACNLDLFYGTDYHSHLGTRRGGMATYGSDGWKRAIHNIENSPFRTKFEKDVDTMKGNIGIGCISDYDPQPILIQSHLGCFGITTVGKINNADQLIRNLYENGHTHFQSMTNGQINSTELVAALICKKDSFVEGIRYVQSVVEGSMTLLLLTENEFMQPETFSDVHRL